MVKFRIIQFGFGSLGKYIFKNLSQNKKFKIVGVVDFNTKLVGKDPGILSLKKRSGKKIVSKISEIKFPADVVIHATSSHLPIVFDQLKEIIKLKTPILSTCEQLVYPHSTNMKLAKKIDLVAKKNEIQILGVGANPGFVMDTLVIMLTSLCSEISSIKVQRVVNLAKRRKSLLKKMLVGNPISSFKKNHKEIGHVGLLESASMICDALKIQPKLIQKNYPIIAQTNLKLNSKVVKRGDIAGIKNLLIAKKNNQEFLKLELSMYVGAKDKDTIQINGNPPINLITNGISGDFSTISLLVNYIPILLNLKPGLHTVNNLKVPSFSI